MSPKASRPVQWATSRYRRFLEESSFLRFYLWKYRKLAGAGLVALVVVDVLEVLPPILLKESVDVLVEGEPIRQLLHFAVAYACIALLQAICRYCWRMFLIRSSMLGARDLRQRFVDHLFGLSASFFDKRRVGDLMSLATNDVDAVRMAIGAGLLTLADALFYFLTVPVVMFMLSPKLTLIALLPLPLIPWLVMRNEKEIHSRFNRVQEQFSTLSSLAQENLNGIRIVKAFAREDAQILRFREAGEEYIQRSLHLARVQAAFGPTLDFTMTLGLVLLIYIGGQSVIGGAVTIGTFVAFHRYIQKMIWPMMAIGLAITFYQRAVASSGRMKEVLSTKTDVPDSPTSLPGGPWKTTGDIEFRNLDFRFPGSENLALSGINLKVESGERVAFVGSIGSGKSALLSLLPRLYPVDPGKLFIDGVDVNEWPLEELRRQVGYVSQEVFLFSESVSENVAFGLHEWMKDSRQLMPIEQITRVASVHDDILGLVQGYQTRLGERGVNLSGGQKQRLTIARALAKQPAILILDDALSSVDVQTEEKILRGLRSFRSSYSETGKNTELIAAHRISTVKDADRIVVFEKGSVVQVGSHTALLCEKEGLYYKFYEQQRLKEDLEHYIDRIEERL